MRGPPGAAARASRRGPAPATRPRCRSWPARTWPPTCPCPRRRSWATPGGQGHPGATTWCRTSTRRPCSGASGSCARWAARRPGATTLETEARPPRCGPCWTRPSQARSCAPAVVYGYFPCNGDGNDLVVWDDDGRRAGPLHLPPPAPRPAAVHRRLLPAGRPSASPTSIGMHVVTMGRPPPRPRPSCSPTTATSEYLDLHGLAVEMAEALAEYWHQRVREELGIAGEDAADIGGPVRAGLPGLALLLRLPGLPRPRGPGQAVRAARARADRRRALRGVPAPPRAVHLRHRRAPPGGQVLQREVSRGRRGRAAVRFAVGAAPGAGAHRGDDRADRRRGHRQARVGGAAAGAGVHGDGAAAADLPRGRPGPGARRERGDPDHRQRSTSAPSSSGRGRPWSSGSCWTPGWCTGTRASSCG